MKDTYINAMKKTTLNSSKKEVIKGLYDNASVIGEENIMTVEKKRFYKKPVSIIAASLAFIVLIGAVFFTLPTGKSSDNSFVLTVNAAEVDEAHEALLSTEEAGWSMNGIDGPFEEYLFDLPVKYKGDNIKSIEYSVNKGKFTYGCSELFAEEINSNDKHTYAEIDDSEEIKTVTSNKLTVPYDKQSCYKLQIGGKIQLDKKTREEITDKMIEMGNRTIEQCVRDQVDEMNMILGDTVVTAKINFNDGTSEIQKIKVSAVFKTEKFSTYNEHPSKKYCNASLVFSIVK